MKEVKSNHIRTYALGDWRVDICHNEEDEKLLEAWLYHKDFGVKDFMFGMYMELNQFVSKVAINLGEYVEAYKDEHGEK